MKAIQMLDGIGGLFANVHRDLRRGDCVDVDNVNLLEETARRYISMGLAVECHGRPLDPRDLPKPYRPGT